MARTYGGASYPSNQEVEALCGSRFQVRRVLGRGAMGVVSEALDRSTGMLVALKTIQAPSPHTLYRLKREFRLVQDLQHENLVSLGELVEHQGTWFFTMELLDGVDFFSYVRNDFTPPRGAKSEPGYDEGRLRDALAQLLRGLDALHSRDFVHRDVKPSNVLVTTEGRTVLLDFGLATVAAESMQSIGDKVVGTAHYMAPEQAAGRTVSAKSDMYAVGAMLYEALTGRPPIDGTMLHILLLKQSEVAARPSELAKVPADLDQLCMDLLRTDPELRPSASRALLRLGMESRQSRSLSASQLLTETGNIVGRDAEWEQLAKAFERTQQEGARALLVSGLAGLGKSTLVQAFLREVVHEEHSGLVLSGRCYERENAPYRGFDAAIDELARHLCALPVDDVTAIVPRDVFVLTRLFPVLGRVASIARSQAYGEEGGDGQHRRTRAFESLRAMLNALSKRAPVVVFIDDAQWVDGDGITLLSDLMQGNDAPRVLWVLAARSDAEHSGPDGALTRIRNSLGSRLDEITLERLSAEASLTLVRELLSRAAPRSLGAQEVIAREAQGQPLQIAELVQYTALYGWSSSTPPRLQDAIWARTEELPPEATQLLAVLCVAATPVLPELLARATNGSARACTRLVSMLRIAQLARWTPQGRVEPYHERVRDAVVEHMSEEQLHNVHAQLVDALETGLDHPDLLVHHLRALGDAVRTAKRARQAAERASDALAFDRAAALYRIALDANCSSEAETRELRLALARAYMNMGQCVLAADEFLRAAEGAEPETRLDAQRLAAQQLLVSGHVDRGLEVANALLAELGLALPKTPRSAMASLLYNRMRLAFRGLSWQEKRSGQITREQINMVEVLRAVGQGLALVDNIRGADFNARFLLKALELGDRERIAQAVGSEATYRGSQGNKGLVYARSLARILQELCDQREEPYYKAWAFGVTGALDHFEGLFERAEKRQKMAIDLFRSSTLGFTWELNTSILFRFFALRHMGVIDKLRMEFEREVREAERRGDRHIETSLRRYCTVLWLARNDVEGAVENLASSQWSPPEGRFHMQHWYELDAYCDLDMYRGTVPTSIDEVQARFAPLEQSLLLRVQLVRQQALWGKARCFLSHVQGQDRKRRLRLVERDARVMMRSGLVPATAWAGLLLGAVHAIRGDSVEARAVLRQAAEIADSRAMHLVAASAHMRLGEIIGGSEGKASEEKGRNRMIELGVSHPDRYLEVLAPGYPREKKT